MISLQVIALIFTIFSVYLSAKRSVTTWSVGIIGIISFFLLFLDEKLYFQAGLQVIFLLQSLYGWYLWDKTIKNNKFEIKSLAFSKFIKHILIILVIMIPLGYLMDITTNDPQPYLDSLTTGLAILATYYLGKSYLQTWLVWMMVNIGIYAIALTQNMFIIMYLELILLIISIYGIINWSIILKNE